jgi:hypothetical protein
MSNPRLDDFVNSVYSGVCLRFKNKLTTKQIITNMKKLIVSASAAAALMVLATGCVGPTGPLGGAGAGIYTDVSGPLMATGNTGSSKVGTAVSKGIICVAFGDSSIKTACANGGITKIHHVDYHVTSVLGVYTEMTVTVYGE